jgi:ribosome-associated toxin RatA of RatAB toxin-antitoxin module
MINIVSEKKIGARVRKENVWKLIRDISKYPNFSKQIDSVRILTPSDSTHRSEWYITIDGAPFSWIELDTFNHDEYGFRFQAVSGDFDHYSGEWKIEDVPMTNAIRLTCAIKFELGIPVIEENCGEVLKEKFQAYIDALLEKHVSVLMSNTVEDRSFPRVSVENRCTFSINDRATEAKVVDLSRSGMAMVITRGMVGTSQASPASLVFGSISIMAHIVFDDHCHLHRIRFVEPLDETTFANLLATVTVAQARSVEETVAIYDVVTAPVSTIQPRLHQNKILQ